MPLSLRSVVSSPLNGGIVSEGRDGRDTEKAAWSRQEERSNLATIIRAWMYSVFTCIG